MKSGVRSIVTALNVAIFFYLMLASSFLILSRWYTVAELLPWNLLLAQLVEGFLRELKQLPSFLALVVVPSGAFTIWRLRELMKP